MHKGKKAKSKKFFALAVVISLALLFQNSMAEERIWGEFSLGGLTSVGQGNNFYAAMAGLGVTHSMIGIRGEAFILEGGVTFSGNLVLSTPVNLPVSLYGTGGVAASTSGGFALNFGLGIKIRPLANGTFGTGRKDNNTFNKISFWAEYRSWVGREYMEYRIGTIVGGISFSF